MEHREPKCLPIGNLVLERLVPHWLVRFRLRRRPVDMVLIDVDSHVRIDEVLISLGKTDGMSRLEVCRPQIKSFADFNFQASREHVTGGVEDS